MIEPLIAALRSLQIEPSAEEVADVIWLNLYMGGYLSKASAESGIKSYEAGIETREGAIPQPPSPEVLDDRSARTRRREPGEAQTRRAAHHGQLYTSSHRVDTRALGEGSATPLRSPGAQALPGTLELARALRPLMRRVPSRKQVIFDEEATADRSAEEGLWFPVLRPAPARWLDVMLVVDDSPSMRVWRKTVTEFQRLLERQGAFRDVRLWWLNTGSPGEQAVLYAGKRLTARNPQELIDPTGQRLILLLTDCVSPAWEEQQLPRLLTEWGRHNHVAIVQMLPQRLWAQTALYEAAMLRLRTCYPGASNARLLRDTPQRLRKMWGERLPLPIFTLERVPAATWAKLVAGSGDDWTPGVILSAGVNDDGHQPQEESNEALSAEACVRNFQATASTTAYELALLLAAAPLTLPVMRLVQHVMLPQSKQVHLAEVFLSGLLRQVTPDEEAHDSEAIQYDFMPGVRDLLIDTALIPTSVQVLDVVSKYLESRFGQSLDFQALLDYPTASGGVTLGERDQAFANITAEVLLRMGGRHAQIGKLMKQSLGIDTKESLDHSESSTVLEQAPTTYDLPIPLGFKLRHTLRERKGVIYRIAWAPDGRTLASGSDDGIRLWDAGTGQLRQALKGHSGPVFSVAWAPDGRTLASGSDDGIRLWDAETGELRHKLDSDWVYGAAWSPDGRTLAGVGDDGAVRLWDTETTQLRRKLEGHVGWVNSVAWAPDARMIISGGDDKTVRLWQAETGQFTAILEGHTAIVTSISTSFDGVLLASKSRDGTVRLWRCDTGENVTVLGESASGYWSDLAFHPAAPVLATLGEYDTAVRIWDLDFDVLLNAPSVARGVSYTNAKVVLVGDTGVGKTGLGVRLAEGLWRPTESTHGMNIWTLHSEPEREVILWDLAGQDENPIVPQLFLNETNVALLLYDPTRSDDAFLGIDYWEKALKNAVPGDVRKILVATRADVGGVRTTPADVEAYCKTHGYLGHFVTSAVTSEGCAELRAAIMAAIPWERLPRTSSPEIFKRIKDFLTTVRQGNRALMRERDLHAQFAETEGAPTEDEFRTVIGHVETAGLVKRLSFGDFVLLKPELLNGYAADIIDAARRHPDGLGAVRKADVLDGHIKLRDDGGLGAADKIFLLHATVELFLRLGLALEQDGNLVFPSKFNRQMPPLAEDPAVEVEFAFEGPVDNLYTTLVVKLYYGGIFKLKKFWKNAAEFFNLRERVCGLQLYNEGDGRGTLKVFYAEDVSDDDKALFLKIIADHFKEKRVEVERQRVYRCPSCWELVRDRHAVNLRLANGAKEIPCQYCSKPIPLLDTLEILYQDDRKFLSQIAAMEDRAAASMERGGELVSAAAELRTENFKQWAGGADVATIAIVFTDIVGSTKLNVQLGDEPWRQIREAHFARARVLVQQLRGYVIKTIGDSVMAAFHNAGDALDFALALQRDSGHQQVLIRAGIHVGPVEISAGDVFGQQVNMAARVVTKAKDGGIWVSGKFKEDLDMLRAARHQRLKWIEHAQQELKGFAGRFTLWSVKES